MNASGGCILIAISNHLKGRAPHFILREMLATHTELACKVEEIERQQKEHGSQLAAVYSIVKRLIEIPPKSPKTIGFRIDK
jgi:hypothetical protein